MSDSSPEIDPRQDTTELLVDLEQRLGEFHAAIMQMAGHMAERLHLPDPHLIAEDPTAFVPALTEILRHDALDDDDRAWLLPRLTFVIGETLCERLGPDAGWSVDHDAASASFSRYVVGDERVKIDPFGAAAQFLEEPPGRDLGAWIEGLLSDGEPE